MKTLEKTIVGSEAPTNKNVLWIDSKNNQIKYNNNNKWLRTSNHSDGTLDDFLPRTGGTMRGTINMNGKRIDNIGIEEVNSLPTDNLYEGRMVRFKNKTYTFYNGLWLALSDDLRGHVNDTYEENFVYQPTAADLFVKDGFADIKKLKGNTLVWNLLNGSVNSHNNYGITQIQNDDGTFTLDGTATLTFNIFNTSPAIYKPFPIGHKGLFYIKHISGDIIGDLKFHYGNISLTTNKKTIQTVSGSSRYLLEQIPEGCVLNKATFLFQIHDLTQMFGEGNEPTIELFEAMFPNGYYEYNEGELMSFDGKGLKSVGFNQFDKTKVKIGISLQDASGNEIIAASSWCSDFIKILPNIKYFISHIIDLSAGYAIHYYDNNFNHIKGGGLTKITQNNGITDVSGTFTTPANTAYIRFRGINTVGYDNVCLNLSHSGLRDGEYQPYEDYVIQWAEGKKISELTSNGVVVFPHGLMSAGDVYDEITKDSAGKSIAIKRCEADTVNLTVTALDTPVTYVLDDDLNLSYKVWDFGTEEILSENLALPFKGSIEYSFNAVDMIHNNFKEIEELKKRITALEQAIQLMQSNNTLE